MVQRQKAAKRVTGTNDIYERVTNKIIADLERGDLTWLQPWKNGPATLPLRHNGIPYSGINVLVLWATAAEKGYQTPIWMTYQQAKELGGHVRRDEHGVTVVKSGTFLKKETDEKGDEVERAGKFLKTYTVFNVSQIEGLPAHYYATPKIEKVNAGERIQQAEEWVNHTGAEIIYGGNEAKYIPALDRVHMPNFEAFTDPEGYYGTLTHELIHWTKHETRLDRDFGGKRFGDEGYAMEELVAELGSAFACASLGIAAEPSENSAAYLASWLRVLKEDKRAIFTAASHAQKAVDLLCGKTRQTDEEITNAYEQGKARDDKAQGIM